MREGVREAITIIGATAGTVVLGLGSALWLGNVLGPLLRGSGLEFLALPGIAVIIFGVGGVWYVLARTIYRLLGGIW